MHDAASKYQIFIGLKTLGFQFIKGHLLKIIKIPHLNILLNMGDEIIHLKIKYANLIVISK